MASVFDDELQSTEKKLSEIFQEGWQMFKDIENGTESTTSEKYQDSVKKAISIFEAATRSVSKLSLFSLNEEFDEVSTSDVKYILLPCLLGNLNGKLISSPRQEVLNIMEIYYKNFLTLCKSYNVSKFNFNTDGDTNDVVVTGKPSVEELTRRREDKIKRYREKKELEELINHMENKMDNSKEIDEELQRNYYVTLLKFYIGSSLEELENIQMEKTMLSQMEKLKGEKSTDKKQMEPESHKPLKPFIITRNKLEKQIYGLGYPSIATMTIDEFYEQRLKNTPVASADQDTTSLMAQAMMGMNRKELLEEDAIKAEIEAETEDVDAIKKQRGWDDWKDDNRRGCGNRKNMG